MVSNFRYMSPQGQQSARDAQLEVNAALIAKKATREYMQRMALPGEAGMTAPGFGTMAPPAPMADPSMGMGPSAMPSMAPALPDPAMDPSIPSPTPPPTPPMVGMSMAAPGAPSPPPGAAATPRAYAEGGVVGDEMPPPFAPTVEQIMATALKLKRGEPASIADLGVVDAHGAEPMPYSGAETALASRNGMDPSQTPDQPEPALPAPPQRFLDWLESPEPTMGIGQEIRAAYEEDPTSAPALWQLVKDFVAAPDDDETDDLPPDLLRVVKGKKAVPPAEPVRLPGDRKVALPV